MSVFTISFSKDNTIDEPSKITESIFQGGYESAKSKEKMIDLGITHIVTAGKYLSKDFPKDFKYYSMEINDFSTENIEKYFEDVYDFIDNCISNGGKVLIHCAAGISRSTTVTCSYLIKKMKISFQEALKIVKAGRSIASPNYGFQKQLKNWELKLEFEENDNNNKDKMTENFEYNLDKIDLNHKVECNSINNINEINKIDEIEKLNSVENNNKDSLNQLEKEL